MQREQDFQTAAASQLVKNRDAIRQLAQSREAKQLVSMLQQNGSVETAAQAAAKGKPEALMGLLNQVMNDPQGAQAVEGLKKKTGN